MNRSRKKGKMDWRERTAEVSERGRRGELEVHVHKVSHA